MVAVETTRALRADTGVRAKRSRGIRQQHAGASGWIRHREPLALQFGKRSFDAEDLKTLRRPGSAAPQDAESFHVRDLDGLDVQLGDKGLDSDQDLETLLAPVSSRFWFARSDPRPNA